MATTVDDVRHSMMSGRAMMPGRADRLRDSCAVAARSLFPGAAALALVVLAAGCGDDGAGDPEAFCADLQENLDAVVRPAIDTPDGADAYVGLMRDIGSNAPLAIDEDWDALVFAYETANSVVPGDAESEQLAAGAIYAAERSAIAVRGWVQENCDFDMGPVATVSDVAPTTTIAGGAPTTSG